MANEVNEEQDSFHIFTFYDQDGNLIIPDSAEYCIIDFLSGEIIKDWADITPLSESITIKVDGDLNAIIVEETERSLERALTLKAIKGEDTVTAEQRYRIKKLKGLPKEA